MGEHTPGPWVITIGTGTLNESIRGPNDEGIAQTGCWHREHRPEAIANARLIAAAPDLLEAVETSLCPHPGHMPSMTTAKECYEAGNCGCNNGTAIAKARGERQ